MNNRTFNIFSIFLILIWIWADRNWQIGTPAYGWLLLIYVSVLFCGSYFVRWGFFLKSICSANTEEKWVALSFDDGPSASTTGRILDILKENQAEAAFFCIGKNISGNERLLKRIQAEDHIIGNHSFSHHKLFDLFSARRMGSDLQEMNLICKENTGLLPRFFRPPYGVTNPNLKKAVLRNGFISIGWSIRSFDTVTKNQDKLINRIEKRLKPGGILLLHDTCEITIAVLPRLLQMIRRKGYQVKRLDKMLNLNPYV